MNLGAHNDVKRLFEQLVAVMSSDNPDRLRSPIEVAEIYQRILPYRRFRAQLEFDTNEDYELALLRLLAGEGGFVSVDPTEVQEILAREAESVNPYPGTFREYAAAKVFLNSQAVAALEDPRDAYAPPEPNKATADATPTSPDTGAEETNEPSEHRHAIVDRDRGPVSLPFLTDDQTVVAPPPGLQQSTVFPADTSRARTCTACDKPLPSGRAITFCPFCGAHQASRPCPHCQTEIDGDWKFCISCGRDVTPMND